ncbi:hypothetical protein D3C75_864360 [compost metagenome]
MESQHNALTRSWNCHGVRTSPSALNSPTLQPPFTDTQAHRLPLGWLHNPTSLFPGQPASGCCTPSRSSNSHPAACAMSNPSRCSSMATTGASRRARMRSPLWSSTRTVGASVSTQYRRCCASLQRGNAPLKAQGHSTATTSLSPTRICDSLSCEPTRRAASLSSGPSRSRRSRVRR